MADREGRLEDRPTKIKIEILPCDNCDVNALLDQLAEKLDDDGNPALILRYQTGQTRFIQVVHFSKHQNPHCMEKESIIPAPCKHSANTIQAQDEHGSRPADSLNPDSLNPDSTNSSPEPSGSVCPHQEIIALYHEVLPELPPVKVWTDERQKLLRQRWKESTERQNPEWWRTYFEKVRGSPFLMGKEKDFRADLEWIIRPRNMPKILEGRYENRNGNGHDSKGVTI